MKRNLLRLIISLLLCFLNATITFAQTIVFHEDFEVVDSMISSGTPSWFTDANYHTSGTHCIRDTVAVNGTAYLTSNAFSTTGNFFVQLSFDQICKINFVDKGSIEVSNNNGSSWVTLGGNQYSGASTLFPTFSYFSSFSYGANGWDAASDTASPQISWWRSETFDLSSVAANSSQVKIRFKITDGNGNGNSGNYGWLIDNIKVVAAPHELDPPVIRWSPPVPQSVIYNLGPFSVSDTITDVSGIATVVLYYIVNSGSPTAVNMTNVSGNIWQGIIPTVNNNDTICYYVQATDTWNNTSTLPTTGCITIVATTGIFIPYSDHFDTGTNLWSSSTTAGSSWQLGTPAFGVTNSAHSAPNAWDIDLLSGYANNSNTILMSPVFNFNGIYNAKLKFWRNNRCEATRDGTRLEYTKDGILWQILGIYHDPLGTNWYTKAYVSSLTGAGWDSTSSGWIQSSYKLGVLNNVSGPIRFRFIFKSDGVNTQDGFSIDDFSIERAPALDAAVVSILRPAFSSAAGSNDTVHAVITNNGGNVISNFNVNYVINSGSAVTQLYMDTLQPGVSDTIIFLVPFSVPLGAYNICVYTSLTGDGDHQNDTACNTPTGIPLITLPYSDNFDSPPSLWYDSSAAGTNWQLGTPNYGVTNSAYSPPNSWDINLNTAYGNNARSMLLSPIFNFTGVYNAKLSFWMNRVIATGDGAYIEYSFNGGATWVRLGAVNDPNTLNSSWYNSSNVNATGLPGWDASTGGWRKYTYQLGSPFNNAGTNVRFRFVFVSNIATVADGISIDNFSLTPGVPVDACVTAIVQPGSSAVAGSTVVPSVNIKNLGSTTLNSVDIAFTVNGVSGGFETWNGTLAPSASTTYYFISGFMVPAGAYDICAYTSLVPDGDHTNDTLCKTTFGIPRFTIPYTDNFDTGLVAWYDSSTVNGTNWQLGTPNYGLTNSAYSSPNSWDINLNTAYGNNARSMLMSPLFDFTGVYNAKLSFWMNRNIVPGDGAYIEYTLNGVSWLRLGIVNDPNAFNNTWYNNININLTNLPGWDVSSGGWIKYTYILGAAFNNAGANVRFRFVFISNTTGVADGLSVDNFLIIPAMPVDAAVAAINQPGFSSASGSTVFPHVVIKNWGMSTLNNFNIAYSVNDTIVAVEMWNGALMPSATISYTFATGFTVPPGIYNICAYTSLASDGDHSNDSLCKTSNGIPRFPIPYTDNFDTGAVNWLDSSNTFGTNWQHGSPLFGQTIGSHSPNFCWDINLISPYTDNARSNLLSPLFDFTGATNTRLSFWQNRNTENNFDGTRLEYSVDAGNSWTILGTYSDPNAINWYNKTSIYSSQLPAWDSISVNGIIPGWVQSTYLRLPRAITGQNVQFRFVFTSDNSITKDGISIDDFMITGPPIHDVGVTAILRPGFSKPSNTQESVKVVVYNFGSDTTSNFPVSYQINSGNIMTQTYAGALQPGSSDTLIFLATFTVSPGAYNICAWTSAYNDADQFNNSHCKSSMGLLRFTIPYTANFDSGLVAWYDSSIHAGTNWQLGTPVFSQTTGAHSPVKCWDINLASAYNDSAECYLVSPLFDFTGITHARLSFWQNRNTESNFDGTRLEYSVNGGDVWVLLGTQGDTNSINWYTKSSIYSSSFPAWDSISLSSGITPGWLQSTYLELPPTITGQNVRFRFAFTSDNIITKDGISIDDFKLYVPLITDVTTKDLLPEELKIYPNPSAEIFYLKKEDWMKNNCSILVIDVLGNEIWKGFQSKSVFTPIDLSSKPNGIYFVSVTSDRGTANRKIILCK